MKLKYKTRDAFLAIGLALFISALYGYYANPPTSILEGFFSRIAYLILNMVPGTILLLLTFAFAHFYYFGRLSNLNTFLDYGMKRLHTDLRPAKQEEMFALAKDIRVLKTWFPDHDDIKKGVLRALDENKARLTLLLCDPFSKTLSTRSTGADHGENHGRDEIIDSLKLISRRIQLGKGSIELKLYDEWPGVPLMWCDKTLFMGFYLRGKSSPYWPWIEVKADSTLYNELEKQFSELWEKTTKVYRTYEELHALIEEWDSRRKLAVPAGH